MFPIKAEHVRRLAFATKLFPKMTSAVGMDISKLKLNASVDQVLHDDGSKNKVEDSSHSKPAFDGEVFCGGRSKNKDLLSFFGLIHDTSSNVSFFQLPNFRRSLKKLINLVEHELELIGAQEILMPTFVLQNLWKKSKRLERQKDALDHVYKLTDNAGLELLLGPTFEESVSQLMGNMLLYESDLPILLYQSSPKFRYEPNPRFGLIRSNEFFMNDLYSFDADLEGATKTYETMSRVYDKIFTRLGFDYIKTEAKTGNIGGKYSHEYHLQVSSGEDMINKCNKCHTAFNTELWSDLNTLRDKCIKCGSNEIEQIKTLELGHTFLLSNTYSNPMRVNYSSQSGKRLNLEMGCFGLGLTRVIGAGVDLFSVVPSAKTDGDLIQIRWPTGIEPFKLGIVSPAKRSQQYAAGSTAFLERLTNQILETTKNIDILIEDRHKESIGRRLFRLQSLGIPNIVVLGQKFLQQEPELELLRLDSGKRNYEQLWFNSHQLCDYISTKLDER